MHTQTRTIAGVALMMLALALAATATAQTTDHTGSAQEVRQELAVIFDLGRFFGYIETMEEEDPSLGLSASQVADLHAIMRQIIAARRVEPEQAEEWLIIIEDEILTASQLMYVDRLYLARSSQTASQSSSSGTRQPGSGTGPGASGSPRGTDAGTDSGTSSTSAYLSGGAFNPIVDATRELGQSFMSYEQALAGRLR